MLARLLALCALAYSAAAAGEGAAYIKGNLDLDLTELVPAYIPDGQCNAELTLRNDFGCQLAPGVVLRPLTLSIQVRESSNAAGVPAIKVYGMSDVTVYRAPGPSGRCEGPADVLISTACPDINFGQ